MNTKGENNMETKAVVVVEEYKAGAFKNICNEYITQGYKISSSACGFINNEIYNYTNIYQAILVKY